MSYGVSFGGKLSPWNVLSPIFTPEFDSNLISDPNCFRNGKSILFLSYSFLFSLKLEVLQVVLLGGSFKYDA